MISAMKNFLCFFRLAVLTAGIAVVAHSAEEPAVTAVGAINWDCSVPSSTFFGGYQTRSLSPGIYRHMTPFYADVLGPDKIDYHWRTQAEFDRELQFAIDAGIDYFAYCWYGEDPAAVRKPLVTSGAACVDNVLHEITWARRMHMKSALRAKLKLCAILVGIHPYTDGELENLVRTMKEDCYQKALGRPLLYMFADRGGILARVRQACRRLGVDSPYAVAMYGGLNHPRTGDAAIDALSAYAPHGYGYAAYNELMDAVLEKNAFRCRDGWATIPQFTTGKDHSPRIDSPVPWCDNPPRRYPRPATGEEIISGARRLRDWISLNRASCPTGHIITFAWNEFEEGGWICPTWTPDGPDTTRVKAFAEAARILKSAPTALSAPVKDAGAFLALVDTGIARDFRQVSYWRSERGPVIVMRSIETLPTAWGGTTNTWRVIAEARRRVRKAGFGELYLHGQGAPSVDRTLLRDLGFDSIDGAGASLK